VVVMVVVVVVVVVVVAVVRVWHAAAHLHMELVSAMMAAVGSRQAASPLEAAFDVGLPRPGFAWRSS